MSRAADYVIAMRASSGSGRRATSNTYVTTVKNSILANTNAYIVSTKNAILANTNTYIAATAVTAATAANDHNLDNLIALGIF
tara:strand:+ start:72 stop:320 length:249 start_codon:yes stop_codon:yes gene_type:complete